MTETDQIRSFLERHGIDGDEPVDDRRIGTDAGMVGVIIDRIA